LPKTNRQTVKPSNRQTVKPSNRQTVKPSNRQTVKQCDSVVITFVSRDDQGRCIEVADGTLLLNQVTEDAKFEGYADAKASAKTRKDAAISGDTHFNSGDFMKTIDVGFSFGKKHYQFVDRVGDTLRWKSENVSTNDVAEIINAHPEIIFNNVCASNDPAPIAASAWLRLCCVTTLIRPSPICRRYQTTSSATYSAMRGRCSFEPWGNYPRQPHTNDRKSNCATKLTISTRSPMTCLYSNRARPAIHVWITTTTIKLSVVS